MPDAGTESPIDREPRRRNRTVHRRILEATLALLEQHGYGKLTIEEIASFAGVGKQTIYRWWPNKAALVMEAFITAGEERVPEPDNGNIISDLEDILIPVFAQNANFRSGTALANKGMMAEAQLDPQFHQIYLQLHRSWWGPLLSVLDRARGRPGRRRGRVRVAPLRVHAPAALPGARPGCARAV